MALFWVQRTRPLEVFASVSFCLARVALLGEESPTKSSTKSQNESSRKHYDNILGAEAEAPKPDKLTPLI